MAAELGSGGLSGFGDHQNVCQVHRVISRDVTCIARRMAWSPSTATGVALPWTASSTAFIARAWAADSLKWMNRPRPYVVSSVRDEPSLLHTVSTLPVPFPGPGSCASTQTHCFHAESGKLWGCAGGPGQAASMKYRPPTSSL